MVKCKSCGSPTRMGKRCKPKKDPTRKPEQHRYCPKCGWSDKKRK